MDSAVVTGAGRGIGRAIALELARMGFCVGLQARNEAEILAVAKEIEGGGGRAVQVPGDVTHGESAKALIDAAASVGPVRVAVANAGQALSAPLLKTTEAELRSMLEVNLISAFHLIQAAAGRMIAERVQGRIVVVASTAAVRGQRYTSAYAASKHGVLGLVRSAALELAKDGITVNAVCPGWVDTSMFDRTTANISEKTKRSEAEARQQIESRIPLGAVLRPEEVASMVRWVVSEDASKLTGQALVLDGGETL
jgi:NAD(P)-dependent dehydrogenase (short-subunit alcohol dehydrogenase family)